MVTTLTEHHLRALHSLQALDIGIHVVNRDSYVKGGVLYVVRTKNAVCVVLSNLIPCDRSQQLLLREHLAETGLLLVWIVIFGSFREVLAPRHYTEYRHRISLIIHHMTDKTPIHLCRIRYCL